MFRRWLPEPSEFAAWSDRAERLLRRGLWVLVVAALLFQAALQIPVIRSWVSATDRLEGIPYREGSG